MDKWDFKPVEQLREECFINSQIGKQIKGDLGFAKFLEEQEQKMWKMRQESYLASVKLAKELEEEEKKIRKQIEDDEEIARKLSNSD